MLLNVIFFLCLYLSTANQEKAKDWKKYEAKEFTILMPDWDGILLDLPDEKRPKGHPGWVYSGYEGDVNYSVYVARYEQGISPKLKRKLLFAKQLACQKRKIDGVICTVCRFQDGEKTIVTRIYFLGQLYLRLEVARPVKSTAPDLTDKFFNSFRVMIRK